MMRSSMMTMAAGVALAGALALPASATGPEWVEGADAGATPTSAQNTTGLGPVNFIRGKLSGLETLPLGGGMGDLQDVFLIYIDDPMNFSATTAFNGGQADFDSRLYLFDMNGAGLLGNDTAPLATAGGTDDALLTNMSDDGTGIVITDPGLYLIAVTVSEFGPQCAGENIYNIVIPTEISGPDGDAVPGCTFEDWGDDPVTGGACCLDKGCVVTTAASCADAGGVFLGPGASCDSCSIPTGACCLPESFNTAGGGEPCVDGIDESTCNGLGGVYQGGGTDCESVPGGTCFGACNGKGGCFETTEATCNDVDGFYDGNGSVCEGSPANAGGGSAGPGSQGGVAGTGGDYVIRFTGVTFAQPPEAIPTLSEWALIVMGLLLVGGITVLIRRL